MKFCFCQYNVLVSRSITEEVNFRNGKVLCFDPVEYWLQMFPNGRGSRAAVNQRWNKTAKHARLCTGIKSVVGPAYEMHRNGQTGFR